MRLVCPNCEAKYEVPDDAIPDTGRDVQCASCGHAWYQMRARSGAVEAAVAAPVVAPGPDVASDVSAANVAAVVAAEEADSAAVAEQEPEPETGLAPEPEVELPAEVDAETGPEAGPEAETAPDVEAVVVVDEAEPVEAAADTAAMDAGTDADLPEDEAVAEADAASAEPDEPEPDLEPEPVADAKPGYAVDDSVLAILREEAERESSARRAEVRPLEVQSDLGIESAAPPAAAAPAAAAFAVEDKPSARRDLLPDVEEINSTLRPSETESALDDGVDGPAAAHSGRGFRSGFLWVMTIAMIGAALYLVAPALSRAVPALADPLESYVTMINGLRLELDGLMRTATLALDAD